MSDSFENSQYGQQIKGPASQNESSHNSHNPSLRSIEMTEPNEPRSRLRVAAILLALAVRSPRLQQHKHSEFTEKKMPEADIFVPAIPLHRSLGHDYSCNGDPNHLIRATLRIRVSLDRRCLSAGQCRRGSSVGQDLGYMGSQTHIARGCGYVPRKLHHVRARE